MTVAGTQRGRVFLARLAEAVTWNDTVRRVERDAWRHLFRKLVESEEPLRLYKGHMLDQARKRLLADMAAPLLPPGSIERHREDFEPLMRVGDYADLVFILDPRAEKQYRLEGVRRLMAHAPVPPTLFDYEAMPAEKRAKSWERQVADATERLRLDILSKIAAKKPMTPKRRVRFARRLRSNLNEFLSATRDDRGVRDEITPFILSRVEAAVAAALRFMRRWDA